MRNRQDLNLVLTNSEKDAERKTLQVRDADFWWYFNRGQQRRLDDSAHRDLKLGEVIGSQTRRAALIKRNAVEMFLCRSGVKPIGHFNNFFAAIRTSSAESVFAAPLSISSARRTDSFLHRCAISASSWFSKLNNSLCASSARCVSGKCKAASSIVLVVIVSLLQLNKFTSGMAKNGLNAVSLQKFWFQISAIFSICIVNHYAAFFTVMFTRIPACASMLTSASRLNI